MKSITDYLPKRSRQWQQQVDVLQQLNQALLAELSAPLNQHCQVMAFQAGILTIACDSAVWATLLRHQQVRILKALRPKPGYQTLRSLKISIQAAAHVAEDARKTKTRKIHHFSKTDTAALSSLSAEMEHEGLKAALQRLVTSMTTR